MNKIIEYVESNIATLTTDERNKFEKFLHSKQGWATDEDMKIAFEFGGDTFPSSFIKFRHWLTQYKQQKGIV